MNSVVQNLLHCFENLMLNDAFVADSSSSSSSKQKSQEAGSVPASMPLYSQSMWAVHSSSTDTANFGAFELISNPIILLLAQHQRGLDDLQDKSSSRDFRIMQNLFETVRV